MADSYTQHNKGHNYERLTEQPEPFRQRSEGGWDSEQPVIDEKGDTLAYIYADGRTFWPNDETKPLKPGHVHIQEMDFMQIKPDTRAVLKRVLAQLSKTDEWPVVTDSDVIHLALTILDFALELDDDALLGHLIALSKTQFQARMGQSAKQ